MPTGLEKFLPCYILLVVVKAQHSFLDCECGVVKQDEINAEQRIINGHEVQPNAYPWIVLLTYSKTPYCGGAIINDLYIITAAHCVYRIPEDNIRIVVGAHRVKNDGMSLPIDGYRIHERYYRHRSYDNHDLALIKLASRLKFNAKVNPICFPEDTSYANKVAMISGWGQTETKQHSDVLLNAFVKVLSDKECLSNPVISNKFKRVQNMCAYANGTDSCQGDSGSALMYAKDPYYYQIIGIVSWGEGCATSTPGVYTRVSSYIPWILKHTKDANYCRNPII